MTLAIVETRAITGGVETRADVHVAAALDPVGGLPGVQEFPAPRAGYAGLLGWLGGFGAVCLAGIEGTGSYGAGLAAPSPRPVSGSWRWIAPTARDRRRQGKSDPLNAVSAARAAQSGRACGAPKGRDGAVLAALRPRPGDVVGYATRIALRELGWRAEFPGDQLERRSRDLHGRRASWLPGGCCRLGHPDRLRLIPPRLH
jgi:hypothetical protein